MWTGERTEKRMREVHDANLKAAEEAGMSIDDWHQLMSDIGNSRKEPDNQQQSGGTEIYNSALYVLGYLFPDKPKKRKK